MVLNMKQQEAGTDAMNTDLLIKLAPFIAGVRAYHHHTALGLDKLPEGGMILAANHSLASYITDCP